MNRRRLETENIPSFCRFSQGFPKRMRSEMCIRLNIYTTWNR